MMVCMTQGKDRRLRCNPGTQIPKKFPGSDEGDRIHLEAYSGFIHLQPNFFCGVKAEAVVRRLQVNLKKLTTQGQGIFNDQTVVSLRTR